MYSNNALARFGRCAYLVKLRRAKLMKGPSSPPPANIDAVPSRTKRPEAAVTGLAVCAVRGALIACSMVPGRCDCVPGRMNPVTGRPDVDIGLQG